MKSFLLKCFLFCLPLVLVYGLAASVLLLAREFTSLQTVIETQRKFPETLVNFGYGNYTKSYKTLMTQQVNPEVLAIGTSRSMEFRSEDFLPSTVFYNAAGMDNASDLVAFIRQLPQDSRLRTVIVGVDARYLQVHDANSAVVGIDPPAEQLQEFFPHTAKNVYTDYVQKKFSLSTLIQQNRATHNIGMIALVSQKGFRPDGSYDHGLISEDADRVRALNGLIDDRLHSIQQGGFGIGYDPEISREHLAAVRSFLEECHARNIEVVGFLPPSPHALNVATHDLADGRGQTFQELPSVLSATFGEFGYHFYDTSELATIGSTTTEMLDVEHTSEKGTLRLLDYLAEHEPSLAKLVSTSTIQELLAQPSEVQVFPR